MALLSVIRRWHFREHLSIREICRRTGLSRNTIRKYLRSEAVEPAFKVPERPSKLDPFADRLSGWLKTEANKPRKQKRTVLQLHADLVSLGYGGSYNRVAAFARGWKAGYPDLSGAPGAQSLQRPGILRQSTGEPSGLPGSSGGRRGRPGDLRASPHHRPVT